MISDATDLDHLQIHSTTNRIYFVLPRLKVFYLCAPKLSYGSEVYPPK
jgi:hypothetical protein